jgi:hypothetical protein
MNINYKVTEVWPNNHQIVVRFTTDNVSEEDVVSYRNENGDIVRCTTDVPITLPVPTPTGTQLEACILSHAPIETLQRLESIKDPSIDTSLSDISENLLNVTKTVTLEQRAETIKNASKVSQEVIDGLIK